MYKHVNEDLRKLVEVEADKPERLRIAEEKRMLADEKKTARDTFNN